LSSESSISGGIPSLNQPRATRSTPRPRVKPTQRGEQLPTVCIPDNVSEHELIAVVSNYVKRNPKVGTYRIAAVLGLAFLEAWPCN
jgi:hypothetical protein